MTKRELYLADTTVWVHYLRGDNFPLLAAAIGLKEETVGADGSPG